MDLYSGRFEGGPSDREKAIHKLSKIIRDDDGVDQVMIPVRDGITIVRKQ